MRFRAALPLLAGMLAIPGHAATLRPFTELRAPVVRLSDLFDGLGRVPDPVLGPAPAPGDRIRVDAPQLAAIARDFGVDWRPVSGAERAVLERGGTRLPLGQVLAALRPALAAAGAPDGADIELPGFDPPVLANGPHAAPQIDGLSYDTASGRFTAQLAIDTHDASPVRARLTGQVVVMAEVAVLTRRLPVGATIAAGDARAIRVRAAALSGRAPLSLAQVVGQALRRSRPPGQPLGEDDVAAPILIARGSVLRLRLDAANITLSAETVAMDAGGIGDRIRVMNPSSHAIVQAIVTGGGEARVVAGPASTRLALASVP